MKRDLLFFSLFMLYIAAYQLSEKHISRGIRGKLLSSILREHSLVLRLQNALSISSFPAKISQQKTFFSLFFVFKSKPKRIRRRKKRKGQHTRDETVGKNLSKKERSFGLERKKKPFDPLSGLEIFFKFSASFYSLKIFKGLKAMQMSQFNCCQRRKRNLLRISSKSNFQIN